MLGHHSGQLLWFGVHRVPGQHLAQIGDARGAQHVFVQERGVVAALAEELRGSAGKAERPSVRHQATDGLERLEEAVRPREEVHVVMGAWQRGRVEAPGSTGLQHAGLAALVPQHCVDAGEGQRHETRRRREWMRILQGETDEGEEEDAGVSYRS